jgi:hypothetical protein
VQQRAQVMGDAPERPLQRVRGQDASRGIDERLERGSTRGHGHGFDGHATLIGSARTNLTAPKLPSPPE